MREKRDEGKGMRDERDRGIEVKDSLKLNLWK